jgi:hypothetical protein
MPEFFGPIRLPDSRVVVPPALDTDELDEVIKSFNAGDDASIPEHLLPLIYQRAVHLYFIDGCEPARLLLSAVLKDSGLDLLNNNTKFPAPFLSILHSLLPTSPDAFGMALESTNPSFHVVDENKERVKLLWSAFVAGCESESTRTLCTRIFPLSVFVARNPSDYARDLALLAASIGVYDDAVIGQLKERLSQHNTMPDEEGRQALIAELLYFVGAEHPAICDWFKQPVMQQPPSPHALFIDMMAPFMSAGYAGAPNWADTVVSAFKRYIEESGTDDSDEVMASLMYKAVTITEPYHLARRLVTLTLYLQDQAADKSSVFNAAFERFLSGETRAINSDSAKNNHKLTIQRYKEGLEYVDAHSEVPAKRQRLDELGNVEICHAPFLFIPDSSLIFIAPPQNDDPKLTQFHDETKSSILSATMYDRFMTVYGMLDPVETHVLGIPSQPLAICFTKEDADRVAQEGGKRCVILQHSQ